MSASVSVSMRGDEDEDKHKQREDQDHGEDERDGEGKGEDSSKGCDPPRQDEGKMGSGGALSAASIWIVSFQICLRIVGTV